MTHYLVLADGGCCGNFLASLIRSMWDLNFTKQAKISDSGSCDPISKADIILRLLNKVYNYPMYPENLRAVKYIMEILVSKDYLTEASEYELNYDRLDTFHYRRKDSVDKFLSISNVKIIYVTHEVEDHYLISLNKISKNLDDTHPIETMQSAYKNILRRYKNDNLKEFENLTDFKNMSKELKQDLILSYQLYLADKDKGNGPAPDPHERILFVKFKDILYNENTVLSSIAKFIDKEVNETSVIFYKQYLEAQKKVWSYVNN